MLVLKNKVSVFIPESDTEGNTYADDRFMEDYFEVVEALGHAVEDGYAIASFEGEPARGLLRKSHTYNDRYFAISGRKVSWFYNKEAIDVDLIISTVGDLVKNLFYVQGADIISMEINGAYVEVERNNVEELDNVMMELL